MSYELLQPAILPEALETLAQNGEDTKVLAGGHRRAGGERRPG